MPDTFPEKNKKLEVDSNPSNKVEMSSLSNNDEDWTLAGSARTCTKNTKHKTKSTSNDQNMDTPRFESANHHNFERFQTRIFPIIQRIVKASKSSNFKFCNEWIAASTNPSLIFDENTTFRDIKKDLLSRRIGI